tara:strand:+ start:105 stop:320 length:216 start_codon:yes stop_codon:yes gene_type:complete
LKLKQAQRKALQSILANSTFADLGLLTLFSKLAFQEFARAISKSTNKKGMLQNIIRIGTKALVKRFRRLSN